MRVTPRADAAPTVGVSDATRSLPLQQQQELGEISADTGIGCAEAAPSSGVTEVAVAHKHCDSSPPTSGPTSTLSQSTSSVPLPTTPSTSRPSPTHGSSEAGNPGGASAASSVSIASGSGVAAMMPGGNSLSAAASAYAAAEDSNVNAKQLPDGGDTLVAANGDDSGGVFMDVDGEDGKAGVAKEGDSSKAHVRE
ncbi:unnamed protein product, partial [Sphacelaria rigidula]